MIIPFGQNILVELQSEYKHALITNAHYGGTKKQGLCIAIPDEPEFDTKNMDVFPSPYDNVKSLLNKIVYFDEFEDSTRYTIDGKKYALIDIKNIRGYEGDESGVSKES
jgi:hypothetical protein